MIELIQIWAPLGISLIALWYAHRAAKAAERSAAAAEKMANKEPFNPNINSIGRVHAGLRR